MIDQVGFGDVHVVGFPFVLVKTYFSDYLMLPRGDDISIFIFCQESLIVMGFQSESTGVQKNVENLKKLFGFDRI